MNLVHIGLHKTGSTALQNAWGNHETVNLNWRTLDKLVSALRHMVGERNPILDLNTEALELSSSPEAKASIFSNEGLSTYLFGKQCERAQVFDFRQLAAYYMEKIVGDAHVLIVTREPISWISSIYKQYVQEGGHRTMQGFLRTESDYLAETLSLRTLVEIWAAYFPRENIIVLPFEMLKENPELFMSVLAEKTGCEALNEVAPPPQANVSINDDEMAFLRTTNRLLKLLMDNTTTSTSVMIDQLKQQLITNIRLELQYKQKISVVAKKLHLDAKDDASLPDTVAQSIVEENLLYLKDNYGDYYGYMPLYLSNFA